MKSYIPKFNTFSLTESDQVPVHPILKKLRLIRLGLLNEKITVIKATLRWENIGLKNPLFGNPLPFVNWRLIDDYPKDLNQSQAEQDTWVDFPDNIPGFMEAYGREGDTEIVDEWLLEEAWQHNAQVLWISTDNVWRVVETGEFLPPLNKI
jgi:hypothetical protein